MACPHRGAWRATSRSEEKAALTGVLQALLPARVTLTTLTPGNGDGASRQSVPHASPVRNVVQQACVRHSHDFRCAVRFCCLVWVAPPKCGGRTFRHFYPYINVQVYCLDSYPYLLRMRKKRYKRTRAHT